MLNEIFDTAPINPTDFVDSPRSILKGMQMRAEVEAALADAKVEWKEWFADKIQLRLFRSQFAYTMAEEKVRQGFDNETDGDVLNYLFGMARIGEYLMYKNGEPRIELAAILNSADILAREYVGYKYIGSSSLGEYAAKARMLLELPKRILAGNRAIL